MQSIGLIGLGNAGGPLAERILAQGYALTAFDIDSQALDRIVQRGAQPARHAGAAVATSRLLCCRHRSKCARRCWVRTVY